VLHVLFAPAGSRQSLAFVLWSTVALAVVLAILLSAKILGEIGADDMWRLVGVVAILDVLGTLSSRSRSRSSAAGTAGRSPADWSPKRWIATSGCETGRALRQRRGCGVPCGRLRRRFRAGCDVLPGHFRRLSFSGM
jgi:hypothetical protein